MSFWTYIVIIVFVFVCDISGNGGGVLASCMTVFVSFCFVFFKDEREYIDNELILEMFLLDLVVDLERTVKAKIGVGIAVKALLGKLDKFFLVEFGGWCAISVLDWSRF